jgi:hypothetical protein
MAEGCPESGIEAMGAGASFPPRPTLYAVRVEPALLVTNAQAPFDVIPPSSGFDPLDAAAGVKGVSAPVAELYLYCDTWLDFESTE